MRTYHTIGEVAARLGLHPQTVYRKCKRGELPFVRFGRTIRIPSDFLGTSKESTHEVRKIPSFLAHLFWEYDFTHLKPSDPVVLERVLELGDLPEWRWLKNVVEPNVLRQFVGGLGKKRLSPKSLSLWEKILGLRNED